MQELEIQKWGDSIAIKLNGTLLQQMSCDIGAKLEVLFQNDGIFLKPIRKHQLTLEQLLTSYVPKKHNYGDLLSGEIGSEIILE